MLLIVIGVFMVAALALTGSALWFAFKAINREMRR